MPTWTTDDGLELNFEFDEGPDGAPTVVLFNGMTQSTEHWSSQAERLSDDFGVLRWDARGQGGSDAPEAITMEDHLSDLCGLLDHLEVQRAHMVGFSHGARVALAMAADRPERVDKLVLCSLTAEPTALARTIVTSWKKTLEHGGLEAMSWTALPAILGDQYLEQHESILSGIVRASIRRNSEAGVKALLEAMETYPAVADLARQVDAETLVLSADEDLLVTREGAESLAELTDGTHRHFSNMGHTIPIEAPGRFADIVRSFLR